MHSDRDLSDSKTYVLSVLSTHSPYYTTTSVGNGELAGRDPVPSACGLALAVAELSR